MDAPSWGKAAPDASTPPLIPGPEGAGVVIARGEVDGRQVIDFALD